MKHLRLRELREARYWSMRDLAAASGVGLSTIHHLEREHREPMVRTIRTLAKALGVKPDELVVRDV